MTVSVPTLIYIICTLLAMLIFTVFDGGYQKDTVSRYRRNKRTIRREGETGLRATVRIGLKSVAWPAMIGIYIVQPTIIFVIRWLSTEHQPE